MACARPLDPIVALATVLLLLLAGTCRLTAAPPAKELVRELERHRERTCADADATWRVDDLELDLRDADALGDALASLFPGDRATADTAAALLASLLSCTSLIDGLASAAPASTLETDRVALAFDPDGIVLMTLGSTRTPNTLAVELERDTWRLRAIAWATPHGHLVRFEIADRDASSVPLTARVTTADRALELSRVR